MQILIEITKNDEIELNKYSLKKEKSFGSRPFLIIVSLLIVLGIIFIIKFSIENKTDPLMLLSIIFALLLFLGFYISLPFLLSKVAVFINIIVMKIMPQKIGSAPDKRLYKITDGGLYGESQYGAALFTWDKIKLIDENKTHIFISFGKHGIQIIPKRYFASEKESENFTSEIKSRLRGKI